MSFKSLPEASNKVPGSSEVCMFSETEVAGVSQLEGSDDDAGATARTLGLRETH